MMPRKPPKMIIPIVSSPPRAESKKLNISKTSSGEQSNKKKHGLGNVKLGRYSTALAVGGIKKHGDSDDESFFR